MAPRPVHVAAQRSELRQPLLVRNLGQTPMPPISSICRRRFAWSYSLAEQRHQDLERIAFAAPTPSSAAWSRAAAVMPRVFRLRGAVKPPLLHSAAARARDARAARLRDSKQIADSHTLVLAASLL
jgi:hypothetical protein